MTSYSVGQGRTVTLLVEWLQYVGGPASPVTGVTVEITPTGGGASPVGPTAVGVASPAAGINTYTWSVAVGQTPGDYLVIWRGTDGDGDQVQATDLLTVTASTAAVPTVADLKRQLNRTDNVDDAELQLYLDAAIEAVENIIGGPVQVTTITEQHSPGSTPSRLSGWAWPSTRRGVIIPFKRPLVAVTSLSYGGSVVDPGNYDVDLDAGTVALGYIGADPYTLVYEAGYVSLPASYKLAILIIAQHLWRTQHGGSRTRAGDDPVMMPGLGFAIPSRAAELLRPATLPAIA